MNINTFLQEVDGMQCVTIVTDWFVLFNPQKSD